MKNLDFRVLSRSLILIASVFSFACAHKVKEVDLPATADAGQQIDVLKHDIAVAKNDQVDVLAPQNFADAQDSLDKAVSQKNKNKDNAKILKTVGRGMGYLNQANAVATQARPVLPEVLSAREDAIVAGAPNTFGRELTRTDDDLKDLTKTLERGNSKITHQKITDIQRRYLDIELMAIKKSRLSDARNMIDRARKEGATKFSPQTLAQAEQKLSNAETVITTSRHNGELVDKAVAEANNAASLLLRINQAARTARGQSPEAIALEMNNRDQAINERDAELEAMSRQDAAQARQLAAEQKTNRALQSKEDFNRAMSEAAAKFGPNEAEVLRQGDNLLIRLHSLSFPSGGSELSPQSFTTLNKVSDVIKDLGAQKVVVEGHTDSTGGRSLNEKISQNRADVVAGYLVSTKAVDSEEIDAEGKGFEKPLASNKTKEGRAQNRRVDIIITPQGAESVMSVQ